MSVDGEVFFESPMFNVELDSELREIAHECEALDQFLRVQNLRRAEEERLIQLLEGGVI